jgi:hypothetical protein
MPLPSHVLRHCYRDAPFAEASFVLRIRTGTCIPFTVDARTPRYMADARARVPQSYFVAGDFAMLRSFCEGFAESPRGTDTCWSTNSAMGASWQPDRCGAGPTTCCPSCAKCLLRSLGSGLKIFQNDPKLGPDHDLALADDGDLATVSGIEAVAQKVSQVLSTQKGEWFVNRSFKTRLVEYFGVFHDSPWLDRMAKLEVIRMAAIPYRDRLMGAELVPVHLIE